MRLEARYEKLGLSQSEIAAYVTLLGRHPVNGSQLSRLSGVPRSRIYEVLRGMQRKGMVVESGDGLYAPLPPEELLKRLRHGCDMELEEFKAQIEGASRAPSQDYVWTLRGYEAVMAKSRDIIAAAQSELYVLLYPEEARKLDGPLMMAAERGVEVKYISMGPPLNRFQFQVVHPGSKEIKASHGGRVFDIVRDKVEILVGMFERNKEDDSPINWAKNHWFVQAIREGIRHDFFHYFMHKTYELGQPLTEEDKRLYERIKNDGWAMEP
jgi:sugar-specific transcriptional regulator TrmB